MAELKIISMDEVQSKEVNWLWYPYIPYGKITIIQGDPGEGKTTLALRLAALLSKGEALPYDDTEREPVKIIYQTAEDGLEDTIKPRLESAEADCTQIKVIDESEAALSMLDERIEKAIIEVGARVVILDPIQAYVGANINMNNANEVRNVMAQLGRIAEKYDCAILLVGHMNKGSGNKSSYRGLGSIDFQASARSVLIVGRIKDNPQVRVMVQDMQEAGFNGFSRGERGSTAENLASLEFKIKKDKEKLSSLQEKIAGEQVRYEENHKAFMTFSEIDNSGKKSFTGKYTVSADDYEKLTTLAKQSYSAVSEAKKLQEENRYLTRQIWSLQSEVSRLKTALYELTEKCRPYLEALKAAPKAVKEFIDGILERFKKQEKSIYYEPIPAPKIQSQEREKRFRKKDYER